MPLGSQGSIGQAESEEKKSEARDSTELPREESPVAVWEEIQGKFRSEECITVRQCHENSMDVSIYLTHQNLV